MTEEHRIFPPSALTAVKAAVDISGTSGRLQIGDRVALNSGGPAMLVVDIENGDPVAAWTEAGRIRESVFSRPCVRRVFASAGTLLPSG